MENEKKDSINFKLRIFLFIYFFCLVESGLAVMDLAWEWGPLSITSVHTAQSFCMYLVALLLFACYALHGIMSTIRMERYAMANLKISLLFYICLIVQSPIRTYGMSRCMWALFCLFFSIFLLLYLVFSKSQKRDFPDRTFSYWGWSGVGLFILALIPLSYLLYGILITNHFSLPVKDTSRIMLKDGEYCDGYSVFSLNSGWSMDSISLNDYPDPSISFVKPQIIIQSSHMEEVALKEQTARENFNYLAGNLGVFFMRDDAVSEITSFDTVMDKGVLCISTYRQADNSAIVYMTCAALFPNNFYKSLFLCIRENEIMDGKKDSILRFMKTVDFDLHSRLSEEKGIKQVSQSYNNSSNDKANEDK